VGAFSGLRQAELMRLDSKDVKLDQGHIEVRAQNAKTAQRRIIQRAAEAICGALTHAQPITHFGYAAATMNEVASNRRVEVLPDGKVGRMRGSASKIPELGAPEREESQGDRA
jgi:integrase